MLFQKSDVMLTKENFRTWLEIYHEERTGKPSKNVHIDGGSC